MLSRRDIFFLVCMCLCTTTSQSPPCDTNTPTYGYARKVTCQSLNGAFPSFPKPVDIIWCYDCNIPILNEQTTLVNFTGSVFNLSNSQVTKIETGAFTTFRKNIRMLLFENNEITSIDKKVFSGFLNVEKIVLKKNNLTNIEAGTFQDANVLSLDLSQNHIWNIRGVFDKLKVRKLNLSFNEITEIQMDAFDQIEFSFSSFWESEWIAKTSWIDLSNNVIFKIIPGSPKSSYNVTALDSLCLQNNKITVIENNTFANLNQLEILILDVNYISELFIDSFKGLIHLATLSLKNNKIKKLPIGIFADLHNLQQLDLSQNAISTVTPRTFSGLVDLTNLNISHNNLKVLEDSHIYLLGNLETLDISDCKLRDFNLPNILEHHFHLKYLFINDNFWTCEHLAQMYKQINKHMGGFKNPAHYFDVPNFHGIACSRTRWQSYDDLTFDDFMGVIAADGGLEDLFDLRSGNEFGDVSAADVSTAFKSVSGIYYMVLIITLTVVVLFLLITGRYVWRYLYNRNNIDKFRFSFNSNQDHVQLT